MLLVSVLGLAISLVQGAVIEHNAASDEHRLEKRILHAQPQYERDPDAAKTCTQWFDNKNTGTSCGDVSREFSISEQEFLQLNPSVEATCQDLLAPHSYCVKADSGPSKIVQPALKPKVICPPGHPKHKPQTPADETRLASEHESPPKPANERPLAPEHKARPTIIRESHPASAKQDSFPSAPQVPAPARTVVRSQPVAQDEPFTNPVQHSTSALSTQGTFPPSPQDSHPKSPTTTDSSKPVITPKTVQSGVTAGCEKFHLVVKGDHCYKLHEDYEVDLEDIIRWNPGVGLDCTRMQLNQHVCVKGPPL